MFLLSDPVMIRLGVLPDDLLEIVFGHVFGVVLLLSENVRFAAGADRDYEDQ